MRRIDFYETQELACAVLGLDYDEIVNEGREDEIENGIYEKFEVSLDQFGDIANALLPFTPTIQGGLTNALYNAFIKEDKETNLLMAIVKREHSSEK